MSVVQQNKWYVEPVPGEETEGWLLTYLDLITLLLVLLVVMLALSGKAAKEGADPAATVQQPSPVAAHVPAAEFAAGDGPAPEPDSRLPVAATPGFETPAAAASAEPGTAASDAPAAATSVGAAAQDTDPVASPSVVLPMIVAQTEWDSDNYAPTVVGDDARDIAAMSDTDASAVAVSATDPVGEEPVGAPVDTTPTEAPAGGMDVLALPELGDDIEIIRKRESISFRINSEILYSSAKADLSLEGLNVLHKLIPVLKGSDYAITVEGHTDAVPVRRGPYPSNWELSSARAGRVVRYLASNGVPRNKLRAIGYADTRPLATNHTDQGRARNRRVEIILERAAASRSDGGPAEPSGNEP